MWPTDILHSAVRKLPFYSDERKRAAAAMTTKAEDLEKSAASKKPKAEVDSPAPEAGICLRCADTASADQRWRSVNASPCLPCDL